MNATYNTRAGKLAYNVREWIEAGKFSGWSSLGYQPTLKAAKEMAARHPGKKIKIVRADGKTWEIN